MRRLAHGRVEFRTRLMDREQAERFARCLNANPRFTGAAAEESPLARHADRRWLVAYRPASAERTTHLLAAEIRSRLQRAERERGGYTWREDPGGRFWRLETPSQRSYRIDLQGCDCSCADYQLRCKRAGIRCKHLLAFDLEGVDRHGTWLTRYHREHRPVGRTEPGEGESRC